IAAIGAVMMAMTSSPTAKGASFLWIPAALQLMAGVWLGPWRGMIAGGIGAYLAGILAYGGWGVVDIIMNPVAGGLANSLLPALLFRVFRIDPTFGTQNANDPKDILRAIGRLASLFFSVLILAFALRPLNIGAWGYGPPLALVLLTPLIFRGLKLRRRDFLLAFAICVLVSAVSALVGCCGLVVGGQTWQAALIGTGIGWFLGDTVSAVLGLYMLAGFTERARDAGIAVS
ncbi:MAG: hypothetical protein NTX50_15885, partial [Candidatus Sumerlaeota bacterium]|nr:hypothetical protein [Candidatus Sumerlaeota bacterium]